MKKKNLADQIYFLLLATELQIKSTLHYYTEANILCRSGISDRYHNNLKYLYNVRNTLWNLNRKGLEAIKEKKKICKYTLSTILLSRIFKYLVDGGKDEKFCYGTGIVDITNQQIIPTEILTPRMAVCNPVFVEGDRDSVRDNLAFLDRYSHTVVLQCHKHPGTGPESTAPSSLDISNHGDWEKFYPVIGIIFVEDGYFRVFSADRKFEVEIYGKGVRQIDGTLYVFEKEEDNQG
jgi:hypothetical protein